MFLVIDGQPFVSHNAYHYTLVKYPNHFGLQLARGGFRKYCRTSLVMQEEDKRDDFQRVYEALSKLYTIPNFSERDNSVLDTLIAVMLSQNTTDRNSTKAFEQLKNRYKDWNQVIEAPLRDLEDCIRVAGLAKTKATRIKSLLETLRKERGELGLENLRESSVDEVEKELSRFKGVGLKTIACVSAFSLGFQVFPVDTHVFRVCKRLGWIHPNYSRDEAFRSLNNTVPLKLRVPLHFLIISHGRKICRSQSPRCEACALQNVCQYFKSSLRRSYQTETI
ncbi:hypothetical protein GpartN1_g1350.t1 [Galdieria partita]|uniref:HhH-GPD domain-containing protein n=1 Tax=Galdieria partita TaxID=83374 RepID=A0A9C7PSP8_9RHOD|nr:hypothetical protein GpartN1_g1350.t1 [Galdieria partita]